ncbi:MAG: ABC transporter permease [Alphaproteobacteria bacterium]|nr:ABC transporter permease [Alphaproteobacteria bacterium]
MTAISASAGRVWAMLLRHLYLLRGSWPRVLELAYWPTVQMILWGFISRFFADNAALAGSWVGVVAGGLIGAVLLWDVLFRSHLGVSMGFLEEMWSRNLGQLFASPLRPSEWLLALLSVSLIRTVIGILPAALLAIPLHRYSVFEMGLPLIAFFFNLVVMGWAIGLAVSALILRHGLGAESLAWVAVFALTPLSGVYYPLSVLPDWAQAVAVTLPSAHIFEGMRAVLLDGVLRLDHLAWAVGLNLFYLALGAGIFLYAIQVARRRGQLLQIGE